MFCIRSTDRVMKNQKLPLRLGSILATVRIAAVFLVLATLSCAEAATTVIIKPNAKKATTSDIYLKESKTGKPVKFLTISDVSGSYHAAEYHNGHLYILKRTGGDKGYKTNPNWTDELWRYTKNGKGTKIWTSRGLDFRVREDERLVAVLSSPKAEVNGRHRLYFINPDGKLVKSFTREQLSSQDMSLLRWAGTDLWIKDQEAVEIYGFVMVNTQSMVIKRYGISIMDSDYDLNTTSKLLAYSDYPVLFDTEDAKDFNKNKTPVKLYVYDLQTNKRTFIAKTIAKPFNPKWLDAKTLAYDNPAGKGTVSKNIRFE